MDFSYVAIDASGARVAGVISAPSLEDARSIIAVQKLDIVKLAKKTGGGFSLSSDKSKLNSRELISVLLNVAELDRIGMPMIHIIEILKDDIATSARMKSFCKKIYNSVRSGLTLGDAFEKQSGSVDPIYASFVKIGEATGNYYDIFNKVIEYVKWSDNIQSIVKTIMIKAISSMLFIASLMVVISILVIPKTMLFLKENGMAIPWYTQSLVDLSNFIVNKYYYFLLIVFLFFLTIKLIILSSKKIQHKIDHIKLNLPIVGGLLTNIEAARFVAFFGIMYDCGVRIELIFQKVKDIVKNKHIKRKIQKIESMILNGSLPQDAMNAVEPFPKHVVKMMQIGFESGNVNQVMSNTKYFLDRDINSKTDLLVSAIKPTVLVFTGLLVGWMALAVFGPIYSNLGNFSDAATMSSGNSKNNGGVD